MSLINQDLGKVKPTVISKSLTSQLILYLSLVLLFANLLTFGVVSYLQSESSNANLDKTFEQISIHLTNSLAVPLWQLNYSSINYICDSFQLANSIAGVSIYDDLGNQFCNFKLIKKGNKQFIRELPVVHKGNFVGRVIISLKPNFFENQFKIIIKIGSLFILVNVLLSILFIKFMMKRVMQVPLKELKNLSQQYTKEFTEKEIVQTQMLTYSEFSEIEPILRNMAIEIKTHAEVLLQSGLEKERANKAKEVAESSNLTKSEFIANISHEIRTPLNAIIGMTQLAKKTNLDQKQIGYVETIQLSSQSLLRLIDDILDFSKTEAGQLKIEAIPFSLWEVLRDLELIINASKVHTDVNFVLDFDSTVPDKLLGDSVRLGQVILNLCNNANKFTSSGQVVLCVSVLKVYPLSVTLEFSVEDTGIGLDKKQQSIIFNKFTQADSTTTRLYGGTGLGLTICKQLVSLMGGNISVSSQLNKGSCFSFQLKFPLNTALSTDTVIPYNETTEKNEIELEKESLFLSKINGKKILLVEDKEINILLMKEVLNQFEVKIDIAVNGEEAVALAKMHQFDCILMDCRMPIMDGYEATVKIRAIDSYLHVPIIAMTADAQDGSREKSISAGMNSHITKPIDFEILYNTLLQWMEKKNNDNQHEIKQSAVKLT